MSATTYRLTPDAQADLIAIRQYTLQKWGREQSNKYLSELREKIHLLAEAPSLGNHRSDVGENVQSFPHARHTIYYLVHEQHLVIFGVLHNRMVPANHLTERQR